MTSGQVSGMSQTQAAGAMSVSDTGSSTDPHICIPEKATASQIGGNCCWRRRQAAVARELYGCSSQYPATRDPRLRAAKIAAAELIDLPQMTIGRPGKWDCRYSTAVATSR